MVFYLSPTRHTATSRHLWEQYSFFGRGGHCGWQDHDIMWNLELGKLCPAVRTQNRAKSCLFLHETQRICGPINVRHWIYRVSHKDARHFNLEARKLVSHAITILSPINVDFLARKPTILSRVGLDKLTPAYMYNQTQRLARDLSFCFSTEPPR
jgi:hypothetical protein